MVSMTIAAMIAGLIWAEPLLALRAAAMAGLGRTISSLIAKALSCSPCDSKAAASLGPLANALNASAPASAASLVLYASATWVVVVTITTAWRDRPVAADTWLSSMGQVDTCRGSRLSSAERSCVSSSRISAMSEGVRSAGCTIWRSAITRNESSLWPEHAGDAEGQVIDAKSPKPQKRHAWPLPPALQPIPPCGSFHGSRQRASR